VGLEVTCRRLMLHCSCTVLSLQATQTPSKATCTMAPKIDITV
jgi:hypothetical protein